MDPSNILDIMVDESILDLSDDNVMGVEADPPQPPTSHNGENGDSETVLMEDIGPEDNMEVDMPPSTITLSLSSLFLCNTCRMHDTY